MEDFISRSVKAFSKFLSAKESILKNSGHTNLVISYALQAENFQLDGKIDSLLNNSERSFYFEQPASGFVIIANDEILNITENGEGRFAITDKKIKEWKNKVVGNLEIIGDKRIPLFLGAMKFMVEHPDNEWKDFNDSTWFIPKTIILRIKTRTYFIFNFLYSVKSSLQKGINSDNPLVNAFQTRLEYLYKIETRGNLPELPKILKSEGGTPKDKKKWKQMISEALEQIEKDQIKKIVLARRIEMLLSEEPGFEKVISLFRKNYSDCFLFILHFNKSYFFGATPEVLAKFSDSRVELDALAGSAPRGKDEKEDKELERQLLSSGKDIAEHNFVIDHIKNSLSSACDEITEKEKFLIRKLPNIQHILSIISAKVKPENSVLSVLKEIYPTPAVCGSPQLDALHLIRKLENFKRGLYSGIIGWFNFENEGDFVIALRSALSYGNKLIAYAGSGIVEHSEPEAEFAETELKLKPILSLFKNEN